MADKKNTVVKSNSPFDTETGDTTNDITTTTDFIEDDAVSVVDSEVPLGTFSDTSDTTLTAADMELDTTETIVPPAPVSTGTAAEAINQVKDKAQQAVAQGKEQAGQVLAQTKESAQQVLAQGKEQAGQVIDQTKSQIVGQLSDQKDRAADSLTEAVKTIHLAAESFRVGNIPYVADYTQSFAGQVDRFATYLRDNDIEDLTDDIAKYARQNPVVFVGGAFVLGLGIARFLKSSGTRASVGAYNYDAERSHALVPLDQVNHSVPVAGRTGIAAGYTSGVDYDDENVGDEIGKRPLHASNYVAGVGVVNTPPTNV